MASEISSLFKHGWENLWKNKVLWLFSSLVLIEPLFYLIIPIQKNKDLPSLLLNLGVSLASIYFTFISIAGVALVSYCTAIGNTIDFNTAYNASNKLFWRIVALSFLLLILLFPFACIGVYFFWRFLQPHDIRHDIFLASIPFSVFLAIWYFPITEIIAHQSKIGESLKIAWAVFIRNFVNLAIIGLLLIIVLHVMDISVGAATMLVQNHFDVSALGKLDFISPPLSFPNNNFYELMAAIPQTIWQTYSASLFTFAYLKYRGAKMSK